MTTAAQIYCFKCKTHTETRELEAVVMKNGRPATRGLCVNCGSKKNKIGKPQAAPVS